MSSVNESNPCVFVHGFLGSFLKETSTDKRIFCSIQQGLGRKQYDLSMPLFKQSEADTSSSFIVADGVFDYVRLWGIKLKVIYGQMIHTFAKRGRPFSSFVYDWREDLNVTGQKLENYLEDISTRYGKKKIQVIAHSMGGMLTYPILKRRPELFESVLFCATPFSPGITFLPDFHNGAGLGISARMMFTFRSPYTFFPSLEHNHPALDGRSVNFYDPDVWISNGLGIFQDGHSPTPEEYSHLRSVLKSAHVYRKSFDSEPDMKNRSPSWPPTTYLIGSAHSTLRTATSVIKNDRRIWNFTPRPSNSLLGDGRLFLSSGTPPERHGITPHRVVNTKLDHMQLVTNNVPQLLELCNELSDIARNQ